MRRTGGQREIDDVDRALCNLLAAAPRTSHRALAAAVGITDETVAARLRRLREQGVLATTVIVDWQAAGYAVQAILRVRVGGRAFREIAAQLAQHPATLAVSETSGAGDGIVQVLARSPQELHDYVTAQVLASPGVHGVTVDQVVADLKVPPNVLTLPIPAWDPADLPDPRVTLDDLDLRLVRQLAADGHASSGALARRLGVSDVTVRRRTQRLEANGLLQIVAAMDPVATGDLSALAFAFCCHGSSTVALREALARHPEVITGFATLGTATMVLLLAARTDAGLQAFTNSALRALPGLRSVALCHVSDVLFHRSHLGRFATAGTST